SQRVLRDLARGESAPRITTGVLPPLPDMPTLAVPPARPRARRLSAVIGYAAALALVALGGWVVSRTANARTEAPLSTAVPPDTVRARPPVASSSAAPARPTPVATGKLRSEEHTSELQSRSDLVCRLL